VAFLSCDSRANQATAWGMIGGALRVLFHRQYSAQAGQVNPDKSLLTNVIFVITVLTFDLLSRADELCEPCSIAKRLINDESLLTFDS
jgi:hypothetical protein